ncbi:MAG: TIGR03086 family metal-binding protein [Pseudonocardiales bacterium]
MDPIALLERAGEFYLSRLEAVTAEAWDNSTPCPGWTVRVVAAHIMNGLATIPPLLAREPVDPAERTRDNLGDNPVGSARAALASALEALRQPGTLDAMVNAPAGHLPGRAFATIRAADTVIHTWDMTTGAGIDSTIPGELVQAVAATSAPQVLEGGRAAGVFGPPMEVPSDADPQAQLLAAYGRGA